MTGWRIAFLHSDKSNVAELLKVHDNLVTCAPTVSQYGAMAALERGEQDVKKFRSIYLKRLELMCKNLDDLKNIFSGEIHGNFVLIF